MNLAMGRRYARRRGHVLAPIRAMPVGVECDPGVPVRITRSDPGLDAGFVRARSSEGYDVFVEGGQLVAVELEQLAAGGGSRRTS
jgi:hypothetical protein